MKKIAVIIALFLFLAPKVINADDNLIIRWSLGDFKFGMNRYQAQPSDEKPGWEASFALGTIGIEHKRTKAGIEINPARWRASHNWFGSDSDGWNFCNLNLFWNVFTYKMFQFGPFNRFNYMYLTDNDGIDWKKYSNAIGLRMGLVSYKPSFHYNLRYLGVECGYKRNEGRNAFYLSLDMDILVFGGLILLLFGGA
jgi:hypothetical protein